jgi:hypothetical protein
VSVDPLVRIQAFMERRVTSTEGTRPTTRPVTRDSAIAYSSTRRSTASSETRSRSAGANASSASRLQRANAMPSAPPATASNRLSTTSCRTIARRPAPSDVRIAISRRRDAARARRRLATLKQAIDSNKPTAAYSTSTALCT